MWVVTVTCPECGGEAPLLLAALPEAWLNRPRDRIGLPVPVQVECPWCNKGVFPIARRANRIVGKPSYCYRKQVALEGL